jgi:uncharacterized protein
MASAKIVSKHRPEVPMSPTSFVMFNGDAWLAAGVHREEPDLAVRQPAVLVTGSWLTVKGRLRRSFVRLKRL